MAQPQNSKLTGTVTWSDGSEFNGFAVIGMILPTSGGQAWPELTIEPNSPKQRIPLWATIPISKGKFNSQCGLWFSEDIDPPGSRYCIYYYDSSMKQVGGPSSSADFFTVSQDPTTPPMYTLTIPTPGTVVPVPNA